MADNTDRGWNSNATGYSEEERYLIIASGLRSHAEGVETESKGYASHAGGVGIISDGHSCRAIGKYNKSEEIGRSIQGKYAFVIGNGTNVARANAFRVDWFGNTFSDGSINTTGNGYATYYEWKDGNKANEDRIGYFVTLNNNKISIFSHDDDYLLGVVCANPAIVANSYEDNYPKMYLRDDWGRILYETVEVINKRTGDSSTETRGIIDPAYDPTKQYIPRSKRPEYDCVADHGIIRVRSDGTCQVNGFCKPSIQGIATTATKGFFVKRVLNNNIIEIVYKDGTTFI